MVPTGIRASGKTLQAGGEEMEEESKLQEQEAGKQAEEPIGKRAKQINDECNLQEQAKSKRKKKASCKSTPLELIT